MCWERQYDTKMKHVGPDISSPHEVGVLLFLSGPASNLFILNCNLFRAFKGGDEANLYHVVFAVNK